MGLNPKNKCHTNFYECCDLTKKVYLMFIYQTIVVEAYRMFLSYCAMHWSLFRKKEFSGAKKNYYTSKTRYTYLNDCSELENV